MIKKIIYKLFYSAFNDLERKIDYLLEEINTNTRINKATQILLSLRYKELMRRNEPLPGFDKVKFKSYSQNGEDNILYFIFSLMGVINKRCVEICAADGIACNTANLIINHSWYGLFIDADENLLEKAVNFIGVVKILLPGRLF